MNNVSEKVFLDALERFQSRWPDIRYLDLIYCDINATPRGKRIPIESAKKLWKGVYLPVSTISLSVQGYVIEEAGLGDALCTGLMYGTKRLRA